MAKAAKFPASTIPVNSGAKSEEFATSVFSKSDYPKTVKENIKVILSLLMNFIC